MAAEFKTLQRAPPNLSAYLKLELREMLLEVSTRAVIGYTYEGQVILKRVRWDEQIPMQYLLLEQLFLGAEQGKVNYQEAMDWIWKNLIELELRKEDALHVLAYADPRNYRVKSPHLLVLRPSAPLEAAYDPEDPLKPEVQTFLFPLSSE